MLSKAKEPACWLVCSQACVTAIQFLSAKGKGTNIVEDTFGGNTSNPALGLDFSSRLRHLNFAACNGGEHMQVPIIDMEPRDLGLGSVVELYAASAAWAPLGLKRDPNPSAVAAEGQAVPNDTIWYMFLGDQIQLLINKTNSVNQALGPCISGLNMAIQSHLAWPKKWTHNTDLSDVADFSSRGWRSGRVP